MTIEGECRRLLFCSRLEDWRKCRAQARGVLAAGLRGGRGGKEVNCSGRRCPRPSGELWIGEENGAAEEMRVPGSNEKKSLSLAS